MIAVVIPTIRGREALYERTVAAYRATADVAIITVRDRPTIGQAWNDGAEAALGTGAEYLHLSADDVEPQPGWAEAAIDAADAGVWPSPRILNVDGSLHSCGTMGGGMLLPECGDFTVCGASPFPFMRMEVWAGVGPSIEAHYYADDFLAWSARQQGLEPVVVRDYCLVHHEGTAGRARMVQRSAANRAMFLQAVADRSLSPVEA